MSKVALLLTGQVRSWTMCKYFIDKIRKKYDVDIFLSIDKNNSIQNEYENSRLETQDNEIKESQHNNIHDIILFVIFGIFVLIILESLYRLISKMVKANSILRVNSNTNTNTTSGGLLEPNQVNSGSLSSNDTFDVIRDYARNRK